MEAKRAILYSFMITRAQKVVPGIKAVSLTDSHLTIEDAIKAMEQYAYIITEAKAGDFPKHKDVDVISVKKQMAVSLKSKGFSLRQIQKALGYKSVRSISELLK